MRERDPYDVRHLLPAPVPPEPSGRRTKDHRCGKCAWGGTGSKDCQNYRPAQIVPYFGPGDAA